MFGARSVKRLATTAPIYTLKGHEIKDVDFRRKARVERALRSTPSFRGIELNGRFAVIFSKEDLTAGLVGYECYDCAGYTPDSCFAIMRNIVLYAGKPEKVEPKPVEEGGLVLPGQ